MQIHARSERQMPEAQPTENGWDIVEVKSKSNPALVYRVDVTLGRCSCPAWTRTKPGPNGSRTPCKHLKELGFSQ